MKNVGARSHGHRLRRAGSIAVLLVAIGAMVGWGTAGVAHAGVTSFTMSPSTGTPGTVVHVSGTGCTPGLLASAGTDFVTVTATTLDLLFRAPVAANGSWQSTFTVPPGTLGSGALVTAVCVSSSVQSLLTIYSPQNFTVTHDVSPPTVVPGTPVTSGPSSPVSGTPAPDATTPDGTAPGNGGAGDGSSAPEPTLGGGISTTLPAVRAIPGVAGSTPSGGGPASDAPGADPKVIALGASHTRTAGTATLRPADLGASLTTDRAGAGSLGWLGWLLLGALVAAVLGAPGWLWWSKRNDMVPLPAEDVV